MSYDDQPPAGIVPCSVPRPSLGGSRAAGTSSRLCSLLGRALAPSSWLILTGVLLASTPLAAQTVTIGFEYFPGPDGQLGTPDDVPTGTCPSLSCPLQLLTTEYASLGITFVGTTLFYGPNFWSGHPHFISDTSWGATFSIAVKNVAFRSYSYWPVNLTAYDASDNVIGTATLSHPAPGTFPLEGGLAVTTLQPIARFSVVADHPNHILNLDDLLFGVPLDFFTVAPCRLVDTRDPDSPRGGPALAAGADRNFPLVGTCDLPPSARAVQVNVAVTGATTPGHLRLFPGPAAPVVATINYGAGQTRGNNAVVALSPEGQLTVRCVQASGTVHFILDVTGYFQ